MYIYGFLQIDNYFYLYVLPRFYNEFKKINGFGSIKLGVTVFYSLRFQNILPLNYDLISETVTLHQQSKLFPPTRDPATATTVTEMKSRGEQSTSTWLSLNLNRF